MNSKPFKRTFDPRRCGRVSPRAVICIAFGLNFWQMDVCLASGEPEAAQVKTISHAASGVADRPTADFEIGKKFLMGDGVEIDEAKAMEIWKKAAAAGDFDALNGMGYLYEYGKGVKIDLVEAMGYYRKGAESGSPKAQFNLGKLMLGDEKGKDPKLVREAITWYEKAAAAGLVQAQVALGRIYYFGETPGVDKDYVKAGHYAELAARQGNAWAQNTMGVLCQHGYGRDVDVAAGLRWYQMAADQNDGMAQAHLGMLYMGGKGIEKDLIEAYKWLWCSSYWNVPNGFNILNELKKGVSPAVASEGIKRAKQFLESKGVKVVIPEEAREIEKEMRKP